jgi:hypothetical protein
MGPDEDSCFCLVFGGPLVIRLAIRLRNVLADGSSWCASAVWSSLLEACCRWALRLMTHQEIWLMANSIMAMSDSARLPQPGGDRGQWGKILNSFLAVEHNDDGTLRRGAQIDNAVTATGGGKERVAAGSTSGGALALDLASGNVQMLTLGGNVTLSFSGATPGVACSLSLYLCQDAVGGRVVTWNAVVKWPGGLPPVLTVNPAAIDLLIFETFDGGATWFGSLAGADYR